MAINRPPRRPFRRQHPRSPEWNHRAYRAFGVRKPPPLTLRQRLARIPLAPKTRRRRAIYILAALGMLLLLVVPLLSPGTAEAPTPTPQPEAPTPVPPPDASAQGRAVEKPNWPAPPPLVIDASKTYRATIDTDKGPVKLELFAKDAPRTVNNFVFLARQGFYDGLSFHRVIPGFMAQGGDPRGGRHRRARLQLRG